MNQTRPQQEVWPVLREKGFDAFTARTAWRHLADRAWVVNFQSFNSYFSLRDGCTTFSFAINLGVYFPCLAEGDMTDVLDDARKVLLADGMAWFDRFAELDRVLDILVNEDEKPTLFGIGARWSPRRKLLIGRAAVATGTSRT